MTRSLIQLTPPVSLRLNVEKKMSAAVTSLIPSFLAFLAQYGSYDATPIIGTVFPNKSAQLSGFLEASY